MSDAAPAAEATRPVWARSDAFPEAPSGWGWLDPRQQRHAVESLPQLMEVIEGDLDGRVLLVWSPRNPRMILPEELEGAETAVSNARSQRIERQWRESCRRLSGFTAALGLLAAYLLWQAWRNLPAGLTGTALFKDLLNSMGTSVGLGLGLVVWLVASFIPWYQSLKRRLEWRHDEARRDAALIPVLRFETWLDLQRAPVTRALAGLMLGVWLCQWLVGGDAISAAGLVKPAYHAGEWWRLLTAPWLHGNLLHFILNGMALLYLGKRVELFARWPHLLLVMWFATLAGGVLSAHYLAANSVGISGGLMGLLGFLLVFESLHRQLVPRSCRRRLLAGVLLTALIGALGYRFIDNAAHLGGLLAGMAYGWIVFPGSASIHRPRVLGVDRLAGVGAAVMLIFGVGLAVLRLWGGW